MLEQAEERSSSSIPLGSTIQFHEKSEIKSKITPSQTLGVIFDCVIKLPPACQWFKSFSNEQKKHPPSFMIEMVMTTKAKEESSDET